MVFVVTMRAVKSYRLGDISLLQLWLPTCGLPTCGCCRSGSGSPNFFSAKTLLGFRFVCMKAVSYKKHTMKRLNKRNN